MGRINVIEFLHYLDDRAALILSSDTDDDALLQLWQEYMKSKEAKQC
jgi:hypothetical protein